MNGWAVKMRLKGWPFAKFCKLKDCFRHQNTEFAGVKIAL
jgi:hypothetical protein